MAKADDKRDQILARLVDFLLDHGLDAATLRALADAAQTSDRMLLYYFKDKEALIAAALQAGALRLAARLSALTPEGRFSAAQLESLLMQLTAGAEFAPFNALWIEIAARAARGDPLYRAIGYQMGWGFQLWVADRLAIADEGDRMVRALRLLRLVEGTVLLAAMGLPAPEDGARQA